MLESDAGADGASPGGGEHDGRADGESKREDGGERDGRADAESKPHDGGGHEGADAEANEGGEDATEDSGEDDSSSPSVAPRPIAPLSTSRVTSRRPTLKWALPAGVPDATVDLCFDRACTMPAGASAHVTGSSYRPAKALSAGVVYWRVHPSTDKGVTSPTWEFTVGNLSAPIDTSWGTTLDVNGDGYADVVVGANGEDGSSSAAVYVYLGSATGLASQPATTLSAPDGMYTYFGTSVASAGDVNGDGYADLVVGASEGLFGGGGTTGTGHAYIYLGSATGLGAAPPPSVTLTGQDSADAGNANGFFGTSVASAGDVNGDGYADVIVGAPGASNDTGAAYVYMGSATGVAKTAVTTWMGPDGANGGFGNGVASVGDSNGDGYSDVVVGAPGASSNNGKVYVYLGGAAGLAKTAMTLTGPTSGSFGASVATAGDVNGDGYADLVVGADNASNGIGAIYVYPGGANGIGTTALSTLNGPAAASYAFGSSVASAGDVNGDGFADLVVGDFGFTNDSGNAYVYLSGGAVGFTTAPIEMSTNISPSANSYFGASVASAGDVNGDGYADIVIGSNNFSNAGIDTGSAFIFLGSMAGPHTSVATALSGIGAGETFGSSVFGASN